MPRSIDLKFSHIFDGVVWNTLVSPGGGFLFVEARNSDKKRVTFSALDASNGAFLWRDIVFDEPWWISLGAAAGEIILFTLYLETNNPDKKGVFAYHIRERKILWWNNDFSLSALRGGQVLGVASKYGNRAVALDLTSGRETSITSEDDKPDEVIRPHQYLDDNEYFATVKTFLNRKFNLNPVIALEYLEHDSTILISFYVQNSGLANYLLLVSTDGEVLMNEKLDEHLKGIGMDTFFILSGCVFFVKNKVELFSYRIV